MTIGSIDIERGPRELIRDPSEVKPQCQPRVCDQGLTPSFRDFYRIYIRYRVPPIPVDSPGEGLGCDISYEGSHADALGRLMGPGRRQMALQVENAVCLPHARRHAQLGVGLWVGECIVLGCCCCIHHGRRGRRKLSPPPESVKFLLRLGSLRI